MHILSVLLILILKIETKSGISRKIGKRKKENNLYYVEFIIYLDGLINQAILLIDSTAHEISALSSMK